MYYLLLSFLSGSPSGAPLPPALPTYTLQIAGWRPLNGRKFDVYIQREAHTTTLRYARKDSVRYHALRADPRAKQLDQEFDKLHRRALRGNRPLNPRIFAVMEQRDSLERRYTVYWHDSLTLRNADYQPFVALLDSVFSAGQGQLEVQQSPSFVLDGTHIQLRLFEAGRPYRQVRVYAPTRASSPLLYRLTTQSLEQYRRQRPGSSKEPGRLNVGY